MSNFNGIVLTGVARNGVIVLDPGCELPEGTVVRGWQIPTPVDQDVDRDATIHDDKSPGTL